MTSAEFFFPHSKVCSTAAGTRSRRQSRHRLGGTVSSILNALNRLVEAYEIPTQSCCLAHITTQLAALDRGAPVDLLFQSIAGTEAANRSFRNHVEHAL
jgi:hypothetical protein